MANQHSQYKNRGGYKRWFDITILLVAHVVLLPIWLILWMSIPLLIWLGDRGPIFYRQERAGKDGKPFTVLKFRTMVQYADIQGPAWTIVGDPRVTTVGGLLRKTGLDELPEVLNIWKGDMSLVGPRALDIVEHQTLEQEIPGFGDRLRAKPGLTGLAQIYDRADNATEKFRYDLDYLKRMNPWLDVTILTLSVWNTVAGRWDQRSGKPVLPKGEDGQSDSDSRRASVSVRGGIGTDRIDAKD